MDTHRHALMSFGYNEQQESKRSGGGWMEAFGIVIMEEQYRHSQVTENV